jgi:hypothetical protein
VFGQGGYSLVAGRREEKTLHDVSVEEKCLEYELNYTLTYKDKYYKYCNFQFDPETCEIEYDEEECEVTRCVEVVEGAKTVVPCAAPAAPFAFLPPGLESSTAVRALSGGGACGCGGGEEQCEDNLKISFKVESKELLKVTRNPIKFWLSEPPTLRPKPSWP